MSEAQVIDSTAEEEQAEQPTAALAVSAPPPPSVSVTPQVSAVELGSRLTTIEEAMRDQMKDGTDYGKVPGTNKPALFKPGAEKLSVLFKLNVQPRSEKIWEGDGHLTVMTYATVFDIETGAQIGFGEGLCTTREKKYGKRMASRVCPACKTESIIKGKAEYGGGWLCFHKKGGCGEKFEDDDPRIIGQDIGEVDNPDLPDTWNTVVKMAEKRARVNAVLAVTGASAIFTQDLDEKADAAEAPGLPPADEEQKGSLNAALLWLLPEGEAKEAWGEIKSAFGGELYGPAAEVVTAVVRRRKAIVDDEAESDAEVRRDEEAQAVAGKSGEEMRAEKAAATAGRMAD